MIPKAPFLKELTPERERLEFERLKARMTEVWDAISPHHAEPHTSVVVPSMTLDQSELRKLEGVSFYEERLLFLLIRLRNPRARIVFVTSQPVHPMILEYYFQLLVGIPASHARARLTLLCAHDASPRSLTEKILERPRLIERIRQGIPDTNRAYLTVFNSTPFERKLAVLLGIPMNGVDPDLNDLGTKSGSRESFREAGVCLPFGFERLRDDGDIAEALCAVKAARPQARKAVIKLDESFSGEGNAVFRFPEEVSKRSVLEGLPDVEFAAPRETWDDYLAKFKRMGGIVEEFLEGDDKRSPSVQLRSDPHGGVHSISTHDQILGGPSGQVFLGCRFPADGEYRMRIHEAALRIGKVLAQRGVVSRFAIDFMVTRPAGRSEWDLYALEINLRMGGTTHPYLALQFLTGGQLDPVSGIFLSPTGHPKYYRATDNLKSERYRGLLPEDLMEIVTFNHLQFSYNTESGVLFHLIGALSEFGKLGLTAIGNSPEEVEGLYQRTLDTLEAETTYGN